MDYFISDTHFDHTRVVEYCNRPYLTVLQMNEAMIYNWNERVRPGDTVFHVGDFHLGPRSRIAEFVNRLNGTKVLVKGNHDRSRTAMMNAGFDDVVKELWLQVGGTSLYLHHQPRRDTFWNSRAEYHLCGHVHTAWNRKGNIINVGVDVRGFKPVTLEELLADTEERYGNPDDDEPLED
jgi:calcineurin-like phosphoesterase family protein